MNTLNNLIIEGNLLKKKLKTHTFEFSIAVNRFYKDNNGDEQLETSFFDVEAYGKLIDICEQQFQKGRGVRIVGRLKQVQERVIIIAEHIEFKPSK